MYFSVKFTLWLETPREFSETRNKYQNRSGFLTDFSINLCASYMNCMLQWHDQCDLYQVFSTYIHGHTTKQMHHLTVPFLVCRWLQSHRRLIHLFSESDRYQRMIMITVLGCFSPSIPIPACSLKNLLLQHTHCGLHSTKFFSAVKVLHST